MDFRAAFLAIALAFTISSEAADLIGPCGSKTSGKTIVVAKSGGNYSTIQSGLNAAQAGDTVLVKAGTYSGGISFPRSGSSAKGCIFLKGEKNAIISGGVKGINIDSKNYISVANMTIQNQRGSDTPTGLSVTGSSHHLEIRNNLVQGVVNTSNAHGMSFYGTSSTPMSDLLIDGNEIRNCKLGSSESMVLNGNVTRFVVSRNLVHDNDNIGIDFIGFEGVGPSGQDQARDGICIDNVVYNISSAKNPAYGGERSADGIYVDGGKNIIIERNFVANSDIGIEIASEHAGRTTEGITIRNNFVSGSFQGNVMMGGYDSKRGKARNIVVVNNTLYGASGGEIILQYYATQVTIKNNILYAKSGRQYLLSSSSTNQPTVSRNLYFGASTTSTGAFRDTRPLFADPMLVKVGSDLHLKPGSPAIGQGLGLGLDSAGQPLAGLYDIDGQPRTQNGLIDIGADQI